MSTIKQVSAEERVRKTVNKAVWNGRKPLLLRFTDEVDRALCAEVASMAYPRTKDTSSPSEVSSITEFLGIPVDKTTLAPSLLCDDGTSFPIL